MSVLESTSAKGCQKIISMNGLRYLARRPAAETKSSTCAERPEWNDSPNGCALSCVETSKQPNLADGIWQTASDKRPLIHGRGAVRCAGMYVMDPVRAPVQTSLASDKPVRHGHFSVSAAVRQFATFVSRRGIFPDNGSQRMGKTRRIGRDVPPCRGGDALSGNWCRLEFMRSERPAFAVTLRADRAVRTQSAAPRGRDG